ncbi:VOC family protein [Blautia sp. AF19-10LB]|uniref:VOC family protein n=1 Tax=Blautia sp. AF19-10LB TaxID=2292961 RepID=UPI000E522BAD|nr:VOC family protein [Blautia sp. AF19-10LB]RGG58871.1 VOC family protein [Blautia sp. AF19-10LB]
MKDYATGIQHVGIPTKDMDATKKFYEDLGFETAFETVNDEARVCFLKMHNLVMEVYESEDAAGKIGAIEHVYKEICDKNMNTLQDEIHFLPFWDNGVRFFTIKGPNEEKIEFSQFL